MKNLAQKIKNLLTAFIAVVAIIYTGHSLAAEIDVVKIAGAYLPAVAMHEELMKRDCGNTSTVWHRDYSRSEKWLIRLVQKNERTEFINFLPTLRKMSKKAAVDFVNNEFSYIRSKSSSTEVACANAFGFIAGIATGSELPLADYEQKLFGRITPAAER